MLAPALSAKPISTEAALVLPVMLVNSPLLDPQPLINVSPVTMRTVKLVLVRLLENVLCVRTVLLCPVESALNVVIPIVTNALVLELENATPALPVST